MNQDWRDLSFLHWRVPPERVAGYLPKGVHPDTLDGMTYVGLIPFRMVDASPGTLPGTPWLGTFLETNVRLYAVDETGRRGVVFVSLDADRLGVVLAARAGFGTPYRWARMRYARRPDARGAVHRYDARLRWPGVSGATSRVEVRDLGPKRRRAERGGRLRLGAVGPAHPRAGSHDLHPQRARAVAGARRRAGHPRGRPARVGRLPRARRASARPGRLQPRGAHDLRTARHPRSPTPRCRAGPASDQRGRPETRRGESVSPFRSPPSRCASSATTMLLRPLITAAPTCTVRGLSRQLRGTDSR